MSTKTMEWIEITAEGHLILTANLYLTPDFQQTTLEIKFQDPLYSKIIELIKGQLRRYHSPISLDKNSKNQSPFPLWNIIIGIVHILDDGSFQVIARASHRVHGLENIIISKVDPAYEQTRSFIGDSQTGQEKPLLSSEVAGIAIMNADSSLTIFLRQEYDVDMMGRELILNFPSSDSNYQNLLNYLPGIKSGMRRFLPAVYFLDSSNK